MDLDTIAEIGDQRSKQEQYKRALDSAVASGDAAACRLFVDHGEVFWGALRVLKVEGTS